MSVTANDLEDFDWSEFRNHWQIAPATIYLNHGSFGPSPICVQQKRIELLSELESQPMEFLIRRVPDLMQEALATLAKFVRCDPENLVFVSNATAGMNVVAANIALQAGDEVLLTDHEYGAVIRIWGQYCKQVGARTVLGRLPECLTSVAEAVDELFESVTDKTRVIVVSHVTSPTALVLPVREITRRARERGIIVVIDGPHAPAMVDVDLRELDCDFYCASCHKWLCAPFGSGFLYVRGRHKQGLMPNVISWGRSLKGNAPHWTDEFHWPGTFDPTPYLTIPTAIEFLKGIGLERFRDQTHALAKYARQRLLEMSDKSALSEDSPAWYGSMVTVPFRAKQDFQVKPGDPHPLQTRLAIEHKIEVPFVEWKQQTYLRVSCHLYNTPQQIDELIDVLRNLSVR